MENDSGFSGIVGNCEGVSLTKEKMMMMTTETATEAARRSKMGGEGEMREGIDGGVSGGGGGEASQYFVIQF